VVDNASTEGTSDYLEVIHRRPRPERVVVLGNESNRGLPAGCNQKKKGSGAILFGTLFAIKKTHLLAGRSLVACQDACALPAAVTSTTP
jgi:hypothetical protein